MPTQQGMVNDGAALAAEFMDLIRQPTMDSARIDSTRARILEVCPQVSNFSFEMVGDLEGLMGPTEDEQRAGLFVETGTPSSVIDSWNGDKLVKLFCYDAVLTCGAAIGRVTSMDFKACALQVQGDGMCEVDAHTLTRTHRVPDHEGDFQLMVPVPHSTGNVMQLFSRPVFTESALWDMPQGSERFERLLTVAMEPRVWKFIMENYIPPTRPAAQPGYQESPRGGDTDLPMKVEVTDRPISSPSRGLGYQRSTSPNNSLGGWSRSSHGSGRHGSAADVDGRNRSGGTSRGRGPHTTGGTMPRFAWDAILNRSSHIDDDYADMSEESEWTRYSSQARVVQQLNTRLKELEQNARQRDVSLLSIFKRIEGDVQRINRRVDALEQDDGGARGFGGFQLGHEELDRLVNQTYVRLS